MSLLGVITCFQTGTYTITRTAADTYTDGLRTAGATSTFTIDASIQPVTGRKLLALPEARRTQDIRVLWTATALAVADKITIAGELYEVFEVVTHGVLSTTPFYCVYCARQVTP